LEALVAESDQSSGQQSDVLSEASSDESAARGHGRAKLILFGEHAVVYGKPAVAAGLPRGARAAAKIAGAATSQLTLHDGLSGGVYAQVRCGGADPEGAVPDGPESSETLRRAFAAILAQFESPESVEVDVTMEVPVGVGLGSSAALAVAAARALGALLKQPEKVDAAVNASESVFHGNPSGIDQMMAAADTGLYFYARAHGAELEMAPIESPPVILAVCQAGPAASTAAMVEQVAQRKLREPQLIDYVNQLIGDIARAASAALADGDWRRVGELMDINHGALGALGVTTPEIDAACHVARSAGALGAKLTGAGGGGCVFALTPGDSDKSGSQKVLEAWAERGWKGFEVVIEHHH
jgi:mevalonate kinase